MYRVAVGCGSTLWWFFLRIRNHLLVNFPEVIDAFFHVHIPRLAFYSLWHYVHFWQNQFSLKRIDSYLYLFLLLPDLDLPDLDLPDLSFLPDLDLLDRRPSSFIVSLLLPRCLLRVLLRGLLRVLPDLLILQVL